MKFTVMFVFLSIIFSACNKRSEEITEIRKLPTTELQQLPTTGMLTMSVQSYSACPDAVDRIVLRELMHKQLGEYSSPIKCGTPEHTLDKEKKQIDCIYSWAKTLKDPCMKYTYLKWLDYFDGKLRRAKIELKNNNCSSDGKDQFNIDRELEKKEEMEYLMTHTIPQPPTCVVQ